MTSYHPGSNATAERWALRRAALWALLAWRLIALWGVRWDIQWHVVIGRDSFWIAPHDMTYAGVSGIVLARLQGGARRDSPGELAASPLRGLLKQCAYCMDSSMTEAAARGWPEWPPECAAWAESVAEFLQVLEFRRYMLKELEA